MGYRRLESLSARRAWIEISMVLFARPRSAVALRKESVDRNEEQPTDEQLQQVALRKESVDRNVKIGVDDQASDSRSPQGERG